MSTTSEIIVSFASVYVDKIDQINLETPWIIGIEGYNASLLVKRTGFRSKDVSVRYYVAACANEKQCKGHSTETFAKVGTDFYNISGDLIFLANVCLYACIIVLASSAFVIFQETFFQDFLLIFNNSITL